MLYLPPLRRLLLPSLICLAFILYYRSNVTIDTEQWGKYLVVQPELSPPGERVPITELSYTQLLFHNVSENYKTAPQAFYYPYNEAGSVYENGTEIDIKFEDPQYNEHLQQLFQCPFTPNPFTDHIRFKEPLRNITLILHNDTDNEHKPSYLNPAIISLPWWSQNQYLLISRVGTDGSHQQNLLCEANICHVGSDPDAPDGERECDAFEEQLLGPGGGMRCATPPITLNVPPTPAENCGEGTGVLMDIPGFHDPRVFWSGRGEPLMMVNSQSRYACFGLWVIDLRKLHRPLESLLAANPYNPSFGPLMSYPHLTEITRNPKDTRGMIEKNWMFFGDEHGSYIHYDLGPQKRSFAKLLGGGITTPNLTDTREMPCLEDAANPSAEGSWHQGTNALRLVLCERSDRKCKPTADNQVFFALIHHKHKSDYGLPMRYERYFIVWQARPPFSMLAISKHPLLFYNETAHPWTDEENWYGDEENDERLARGEKSKGMFAVFTYTVSIAYAWGRKLDEPHDKMLGYLDDDVVLGIGIDDMSMVYAKIQAKDLLSCLRACPARAPSPLYVSPNEQEMELDDPGVDLEEFQLPLTSIDPEVAASQDIESIKQEVATATDSSLAEQLASARAAQAVEDTTTNLMATSTTGVELADSSEVTAIATAPIRSHTLKPMDITETGADHAQVTSLASRDPSEETNKSRETAVSSDLNAAESSRSITGAPSVVTKEPSAGQESATEATDKAAVIEEA